MATGNQAMGHGQRISVLVGKGDVQPVFDAGRLNIKQRQALGKGSRCDLLDRCGNRNMLQGQARGKRLLADGRHAGGDVYTRQVDAVEECHIGNPRHRLRQSHCRQVHTVPESALTDRGHSIFAPIDRHRCGNGDIAAIAVIFRVTAGHGHLAVHLAVTIPDAVRLKVIQILRIGFSCRINAVENQLRRLEIVIPHDEGAQGEIAVSRAVPTPVDVILAVVIAVNDKGVAASRWVTARIQDGASGQQFLLQQRVPLLVGVIPLRQLFGAGIVPEGLHARQLLINIGTAAIRTVVHARRLSAVAHQRSHGIGLSVVIGRCYIIVEH